MPTSAAAVNATMQKAKIDAFLGKIERATSIMNSDANSELFIDDELISHMVKYACILIYGHMELRTRKIFTEYAERKTSESSMLSYVGANMRRFERNIQYGQVAEEMSKFNESWKGELNTHIDSKTGDVNKSAKLKDSLNYISIHRNKISHGGQSDITYSRLSTGYKDSLELFDIIDEFIATK